MAVCFVLPHNGLAAVAGRRAQSGWKPSGALFRETRMVISAKPDSKKNTGGRVWRPSSWREMPVKQVPTYPDEARLQDVEARLHKALPLVYTGECEHLKKLIAKASRGEAFVLQGGDCAESFEEFEKYGGDNIRDTFLLLIQMSIVLMYALGLPVVKIGRMAGQFAKPRTSPMEREKNKKLELPSYRGDMINGPEFEARARVPDPERMLRAYHQSTATINLVRALAYGGFVDLHRIHEINLEFVNGTPQGKRFFEYAARITDALRFMSSCGIQANSPMIKQAEFFVSHEALLLPYEEALVRQDRETGKYYATSGHMIWCGDRTRQPDGGHVEFLRGIANPIGIKCGPSLTEAELIELLDILNPDNEPGRITLISRVGAGRVREHLPRFIECVQREGRIVTWSCDPMHGNTVTTASGVKTRRFDDILSEVKEFFEVHREMGSIPGGIHLEMTGQNVTECIGGMYELSDADLATRFESRCDPRLNASQSLELAFLLSEYMSGKRTD
ncbi:3-deoxy-7-phosphoheptulonate synthase [Cyanidioschyzon merolae strain 10D]|jgi:3-deoxy-7-phosphoheptulonate synthase|uniref:Phospho-2-dehydro-3-deoxyheptonate aldolase n=1 Tax=Cyanidioschyzon merolae (strain NIES-3377 / 10D) TaxID=280699 RepID=M1V6B0_CYAM1|nr:3-deoxy-7-phosphoheptulonate synthase [Cyanidioschyzon merolae strain 10D]BAM82030.1 3-deoxy-7-phosphoheptulonate synthase [Cyanidioschyzon merolae strain 10D]|eukprot:XP_005538066.1 3-deoxy-7-phosphoheptulonate synthase [Cyanidioschyzon merolae strain 10D]